MKKRRNRVVALVVGLCLLLAAGVLAVDRVSSVMFDHGLFEAARPSMSDVLDGRVADPERQAALQAVDSYADALNISGVSQVAAQSATWCREGQNNWKRQDGYRLSCDAVAISFLAWSGDFERVQRSVRAELAGKCGAPVGSLDNRRPIPGEPTTVEEYECDSGLTLRMNFDTPVDVDQIELSLAADSNSSRHVSGPSPEDMPAKLAPYKWFALVRVSKTFYEDKP